MDILSTPDVAALVQRLFEESSSNHVWFREQRQRLAERGVERGTREYSALTRQAYLAVTPQTARLLYLLVRSARARTVVEFGTSFGVSTLHLAAGLRDNGGGAVISTELEPSKAARARRNLAEAGLDDLVEILEGDARGTLPERGLSDVDLVFLDGANHLYGEVLTLLEPLLAEGALVVADNVASGPFRERLDADPGYLTVPFESDRVSVSLRLDSTP